MGGRLTGQIFLGVKGTQATEELAREFACFVISRGQSRIGLWGTININNQTNDYRPVIPVLGNEESMSRSSRLAWATKNPVCSLIG